MIMSSPVKELADRYPCHRGSTYSSDIADDLLVIHELSGADAVASFHGIGKATYDC